MAIKLGKKIDSVQVSIYGSSPEMYKIFSKNANGYTQSLAFIEGAINSGVNVSVELPDLTVMAGELPGIEKWARSIGITVKTFKVVVRPHSYDPLKELSVEPSDNITSADVGLKCGAGSSSVRISSAGRLKGCHLHKVGIKISDPKLIKENLMHLSSMANIAARDGIRFCGAKD